MVAEELFNEAEVKALLKPGGDQSAYYRAVLQNFFFATLNTGISKRAFSGAGNATHRDFSRCRYSDLIADKKRFWTLIKKTPFINGGLLDCLDSFEATSDDGYRIDCFSDAHCRYLSAPDSLFFGEGGLITLLAKYKFTVEESTPVEEEVALNPELLGKVYEVETLGILNENLPAKMKRGLSGSFIGRDACSIFSECGFDKSRPIREQEPNPLPDRKALDDIVFDAIGLTEDERREAYLATCELVQNRISRAKNIAGGARS